MAFGFDEPGIPPVPAASAWQAPQTQTGTLATSINVTSMTNTAGLYPGMGVSGTGIVAGTVIASIVSGTALTLSIAATVSGANALTFTAFDPYQTAYMGSGYPFPFPSLAATLLDTPDSAFNIPDAQVLTTATTYVPAPGRGILTIASGTTAAAVVQYNIAPTPTWTTILTGTISATVAFYVMADGVNVRWNNLSATNSTFTFYRERSSKSTGF